MDDCNEVYGYDTNICSDSRIPRAIVISQSIGAAMKNLRMFSIGISQCLVIPVMLFASSGVAADERTLECKLYIADTQQSETISSVTLEDAGLTLSSSRHSGYCVFADGSVADKQFVEISRAVGDGATGSVLGYSVYSMQSGGSLLAEFTGEWNNGGFIGQYSVLGGSGPFENATGDGTVTATQSPWATTGTYDVVFNINTP